MASPRSATSFSADSAFDLLGFATAAAIGVKLSLFVERVRDLGLNDETLYLASGARWGVPGYPNLDTGLPPADWSPVYALWYRLLFAFEGDRVRLYYLNWQLLVTGTSVLLYAFQRALKVGRVVALAMTFVLTTSFYFEVWPYPMHFAVMLLLLGGTLAVRSRSWNAAAPIVAVTFVLAAFVRPELSIAAEAASAFAVGRVVLGAVPRFRIGARGSVVASAPLALGAVLVAAFGNPLGGARAFYAWGQHYAFNVATAEHLTVDPWLHWYELVERDFGHVSDIGGAFRANHGAFVQHLARNLAATTKSFGRVVEPFLCGPPVPDALPLSAWGAMAVVAIAGLALGARRRRREGRPVLGFEGRVVVLLASLVLVSVTGGIVLVYPREHYLLPIVALSVASMGVGLSALVGELAARWPRLARLRSLALPLVAAALLTLTPNRTYGWSPQTAAFGTCASARLGPVRWTIDALKRLAITRHVVALELGWGFVFYAGYDATRVVEWAKDEPFLTYVRTHDISLMVLTDEFLRHPKYGSDPEYAAFLKDPSAFGFTPIPVQGTSTLLAIRNDVFATANASR